MHSFPLDQLPLISQRRLSVAVHVSNNHTWNLNNLDRAEKALRCASSTSTMVFRPSWYWACEAKTLSAEESIAALRACSLALICFDLHI